MIVVPMKEVRLVVVVDNLNFRIKDVAFEVKCSIGMAPLIELQIGAWKIQAMHICIVIFWTWQL
jgi:hypothetical protein